MEQFMSYMYHFREQGWLGDGRGGMVMVVDDSPLVIIVGMCWVPMLM